MKKQREKNLTATYLTNHLGGILYVSEENMINDAKGFIYSRTPSSPFFRVDSKGELVNITWREVADVDFFS